MRRAPAPDKVCVTGALLPVGVDTVIRGESARMGPALGKTERDRGAVEHGVEVELMGLCR
jgi:hypothetical protein